MAARISRFNSQKQNTRSKDSSFGSPQFMASRLLLGSIGEAEKMEATISTGSIAACRNPLPDLEIPMINAMAACLGSEHKRFADLIMQLAFAAARLATDPDSIATNQRALEAWDEIRRDLWSHLQIEDELISWGMAHEAISPALADSLKNERREMRKLIAAMAPFRPGVDPQQTASERASFAPTLLALAQTLDSHVERSDGQVLPSIRRALFHKQGVGV